MKIVDYLPIGRENAIPSKRLADALGFDDVRTLQSAIERERRAGSVILSTTIEGGGYFTSNDPREIAFFIRTLNRRAKHTRDSTLSAQIKLDKLTGQTVIDGL